jgi:hypothetical protein
MGKRAWTAAGQRGPLLFFSIWGAAAWFESFQNWQSEFLAVAVLVGASVYLREKGSPESKPVAEPHYETGA